MDEARAACSCMHDKNSVTTHHFPQFLGALLNIALPSAVLEEFVRYPSSFVRNESQDRVEKILDQMHFG